MDSQELIRKLNHLLEVPSKLEGIFRILRNIETRIGDIEENLEIKFGIPKNNLWRFHPNDSIQNDF